MKAKRLVSALTMIALLAGIFAGCSGDGGTTSSTGGDSSTAGDSSAACLLYTSQKSFTPISFSSAMICLENEDWEMLFSAAAIVKFPVIAADKKYCS